MTDPVEAVLDGEWRGIGGEYVVMLGDPSCVEPGSKRTLPTVTATVNAFTRLWFGVRSASSLAVTDHLTADASLLTKLDNTLRLPQLHTGWDF